MRLPLVIAGTGLVAAVAAFFSRRAAASESRAVDRAPSTRSVWGPRVNLRLTRYWPTSVSASEAERRMEGGDEGAAKWRGKKAVDPATGRRPILYTLEDALAGRAPYVSLSGDPDAWPFGQRIEIDAWPGVVFRVVDTGENFTGSKKTYKTPGTEPVDVRVASSRSRTPDVATGVVVEGDNFDGGSVNFAALRGQNMTVTGYAILGSQVWDEGRLVPDASDADVEALARAVESSRPEGSLDEKQAVGWVCRNRAARLGLTVCGLLAPDGRYGPRREGREFVSTEIAPGSISSQVARAVLRMPAEMDPTGGATDFWCPVQQREQYLLAEAIGDEETPSEEEARDALLGSGLRVVGEVGDLELLA